MKKLFHGYSIYCKQKGILIGVSETIIKCAREEKNEFKRILWNFGFRLSAHQPVRPVSFL